MGTTSGSDAVLRPSCIITCHNYAAYVRQAVESVFAQSARWHDIVIIDDASSDDSPNVLRELCRRSPALKVFRHDTNSGQLAAFETAIEHAAGNLLFFLDADDVYARDYLAIALDIYGRIPKCDFLYCRNSRFSNGADPPLISETRTDGPVPTVTDLGQTLVRTLISRSFVGGPTSCLSMRRSVAKRLFPLPLHEDWRIRADDCLVFGASLAGAHKFRVEADLVGYRVHGRNAFANNPAAADPDEFLSRQVALGRLFQYLRGRLGLGPDVEQLAHLEFKTVPRPSLAQLREYVEFVLKQGASGAGRVRAIALMLKWYLRSNRVLGVTHATSVHGARFAGFSSGRSTGRGELVTAKPPRREPLR